MKKDQEERALAGPPLLSVCVVTYNQQHHIKQCLQTLVEQQVNFPFEIIVGDDCSTDGTWAAIEEIRSQYPLIITSFRQTKNVGATRNYFAVHDRAKGDLVVHLDGDDYALPGKLSALVEFMNAHPECAIAWHRMVILTDDKRAAIGMPLRRPSEIFGTNTIGIRTLLLSYGATGCHSGSIYRRAARTLFNETENTLDYFITLSMCLSGGMAGYIDEPYGVYRYSSTEVTLTKLPENKFVHDAKLRHLAELLNSHPHYRREICAHAVMEWLKLWRLGFSSSTAYYRIARSTKAIPRVRDLIFIWRLFSASRNRRLLRTLAPAQPEWL